MSQYNQHNPQYPSKVLTKNLSQTARSLSEANRDAYYCSALIGFKSDAKLTLDFLANALIGALFTLVAVGAVGGFLYWIYK